MHKNKSQKDNLGDVMDGAGVCVVIANAIIGPGNRAGGIYRCFGLVFALCCSFPSVISLSY
jgi:hypothetical protein